MSIPFQQIVEQQEDTIRPCTSHESRQDTEVCLPTGVTVTFGGGAARQVCISPPPPRLDTCWGWAAVSRRSSAKLWAAAGVRGLSFNRRPQTVSASAVRS